MEGRARFVSTRNCIYQELYLPTFLMMEMNCSPEDPWLNCDFNQ